MRTVGAPSGGVVAAAFVSSDAGDAVRGAALTSTRADVFATFARSGEDEVMTSSSRVACLSVGVLRFIPASVAVGASSSCRASDGARAGFLKKKLLMSSCFAMPPPPSLCRAHRGECPLGEIDFDNRISVI